MDEETTKQETKTGERETSSRLGQSKEREFIISLRRKFRKTARYRRAPKAIRAIKEFLARHMKIYDRDLKKIKIDKYLNEFVWTRGIRNPPAKIKIKAIVDGNFIRAGLAELSEKLRFKKDKLEKREKMAAEVTPKRKESEAAEEAKAIEKTETRPSVAKSEEEKTEEKEKKAAVVEAGQKMEKAAAKKMKHEMKISRQPKRQRRMALAK